MKHPHLATTALEEFWDTSRPMVFLGEWCRRYGRRSSWEGLDAVVLENPWGSWDRTLEAYRYVATTFERILPVLSGALGNLHGTTRGQRYWRIVLGPWLLWFLPSAYDRYTLLRSALDRYPDATTLALDERSYVTPADTFDALNLLTEDAYNLQLYSRVLTLLGKEYPRKPILPGAASSPGTGNPGSSKGLALRAAGAAACVLDRIGKLRGAVFLKNAYFSRHVVPRLVWKTKGKAWPLILDHKVDLGCVPVDPEARKEIRRAEFSGDEFASLLMDLVAGEIPKCFVEGFEAIGKLAETAFPRKPKAIFSAESWYHDEIFKRWAAASGESGTLLLGMQHGGNYGSLAYHPSEDHELSITDRYYTWGWDREDWAGKIVRLSAAKLSGRKKLGGDNRQDGILLAAAAGPRYLLQFPYLPSDQEDYYRWQKRFLASLAPHLLELLRFRAHWWDCGWDVVLRVKEDFPRMAIDDRGGSFLRSLERSRLFVCDHPQSTFLEALSVEKPTILFWAPGRLNEMRPAAAPYYDRLRTAGILFDSPEDAAEAVKVAYRDVAEWWAEPHRRQAVRDFCIRFARTYPGEIRDWAAEFGRIARERSVK